jgi:hypothetical protein
MLAGMQLDVFTPLAGDPLRAEQVAQAIGVGVVKLKPLLYALVVAGQPPGDEGWPVLKQSRG